MKTSWIFLFICFVCFSSIGQNEIIFDYSVTYKVPNKKKATLDTIMISYTKSGSHLFTNSQKLAVDFGMEVFGAIKSGKEKALMLVYDAKEAQLQFNYEVDNNLMYMQFDISTLLEGSTTNIPQKDMELLSEKIDEFNYLGRPAKQYKVYPEGNESEAILLVVDAEREVENENLLTNLMKAILFNSQSNNKFTIDVPDGLILSIMDAQGNSIIEAINIDDSTKTIEYNHTFKIKE